MLHTYKKQLADNAENMPAPPVPEQRSTPKMTCKRSRVKKRKTSTFLPNGNIVGTTEDSELSDYDISEFTQL